MILVKTILELDKTERVWRADRSVYQPKRVERISPIELRVITSTGDKICFVVEE
jgi:hypothetical protein